MAPSSSAAATTSVQVALRIRPTTKQDTTTIPTRFQRTVIHANSNQVVSVDPISVQNVNGVGAGPVAAPSTPSKKQTFAFDQVHGPETSQFDLFRDTAAPLLSRFLEGYNCTILAYGQTSSGKTYSMTGIDLDADPADPSNGMGIIPRSISEIFSRAAALKEERSGAWSYSIKGSFIELYNEELIDLLSYDDMNGGRRDVQIREDKHGHIIWDGLREVSVRNSNEVMNLIRQGTAIRRTNETDMNAQSSRSHAIFSLTLTQRKYTGSGLPPRSATPSGTVRSPSRLARPASHQFNSNTAGSTRVSSPTFGRPPTPSFASAMGRGGGTLRPSSAMGSHSADGRAKNVDDDSGEWITIVSKFHFVDLAGSERLKRTAAAGERVKEGISINSGLLALGNVISALGDPSRAKSHTASHVPYRDSKLTRLLQDSLGGNAHTLMIACVSPAEWNAGETINTLKYANRARNIKNRAVVTEKEEGWDDLEWLQNMVTRLRKEMKGLKEGSAVSVRGDAGETEGASKKVLTQMVELQSNYEDLRAKFVERTEELTRLRRELGERHRNSTSGTISGTAKYEEIVGPVIEEYEKTINAMEAELSLNRAALRHTNDLVEEKEEELAQLTERHSATEMYVEELKSRVSKLAEREASTEAYIRDLEEKIKLQEDTTVSSSESVTDLKREIARFKESEGQSAHYIAELEGRLARCDESILTLRSQVEKLESESDSKRREVEILQARLDGILNDGESWRSDLEDREKRVRELEAKMEEWQSKRLETNNQRARLGQINSEVQHARRSLELDMAQAAKAIKIVHPESTSIDDEPSGDDDESLQHQLKNLRETHAATLADLSSVTSKYRDALKEISDLAAQINEIKLGSPSGSDELDRQPETPISTTRRRPGIRSREPSEGHLNTTGRQLFFRQAASTESLRSRSLSQSQSLSQELYSARSRMLSSPEINGVGISGVTPPLGHANRHSPGGLRPNLSISLPIGPGHERSVPSLEKEIMRLQEVLKEREAEITSLESTLKDKEKQSSRRSEFLSNGHRESRGSDLSPQIMNQINAIRKSMEIRNPPPGLAADNEPLDRLNELMLSMAQKEAQHHEEVEELNDQLAQIRRQYDDLTKLSRDQTMNMSTELDSLRTEHQDVMADLDALRKREASLLEERTLLEEQHEESLKQLKAHHEQALCDKQAEVDALLERVKESLNAEQDDKLIDLQKQLADASDALTKSHHEHEAFGKLKSEHEEELRKLKEDVDRTLAQAQEEHKAEITKLVSEHEALVKEKEDTLHRTEEEYYQALSKLRVDHADALSRKDAEMQAAIDRLKEEHAGAVKMAELAREGSLTESQSQQVELLKQLQDEHDSAIDKKEVAFAEDLRKLKEEHATILEKKQLDHSASVERLKSKQAARLAELEESKNLEIEALQKTLATTLEQHDEAKQTLSAEKEAALRELQQQHSNLLTDVQRSHEESLSKLKEEFQTSSQQADAAHEESRRKLQEQHAEEILKMKAEHQQIVSEFENANVAALDQHRQDLENARSQSEALLAQERDRLSKTLADAEANFSQERETLRKDHELLLEEVASYKAAADDYVIAQEETRRMHADALAEKDKVIASLREGSEAMQIERLRYESELEDLRKALALSETENKKLSQTVAQRERVAEELERQRTLLNETRAELQKTKEHSKHDVPAGLPSRPGPDRRAGMSKLPPLTPPPSVPPPPAPKSVPPLPSSVPMDVANSVSSQSNTLRSSASSRESNPESPATSTSGTSVAATATDPKISTQLEEQAKHIEEQEVMIKTLNKQLSHCESDLQAHMDLVSTLETSLGDSEKNLRKARMQATELARERDTLNTRLDAMRRELDEARRELAAVRRSVIEEKQSLESRLDEERRAKERVRQQLDMRVEELQKRKSKFVCL
ncbi:kinesin [Fomitiporia mediterranea MF3/22]|uniref:kinesin n=1 Tax=Fomitiporia mediterranea (strain MF3/22) TaxID=694068 RepID=UPI0004408747|nr:kinesin [Fomitiporia mediterranea MF3/22]EJD02223.1 kinesin [Fomitiporia mediterranea MF3/22]